MSYENPRINDLSMSPLQVVFIMANANPGAMRVMTELLRDGHAIDPDSAFGGLGVLMDLDSRDIYGDRIWMLYSDVCKCDLVKFCAILRAYQLGQLAGVTEAAINHAIDNRGDGLDLDAILAAVRERLPNFAPVAEVPAPPEVANAS